MLQETGVKISVRSNIFEVTAASTLEAYASHVKGPVACTALVLSEHALTAAAHEALIKSLASLGYGDKGVAFALLNAEGTALGAPEVFSIIEGLDPLCLVVADEASARLLSQAYRCPIAPDAYMRLLGRPSAVFKSFESMLADAAEKQRAWAVLKRIPKLG